MQRNYVRLLQHLPHAWLQLHQPRLDEALRQTLGVGVDRARLGGHLHADVLAQGADTVVAGAYTQSNWCRQMTAAARKLGLEVALLLLHGGLFNIDLQFGALLPSLVLIGLYMLYMIYKAIFDAKSCPAAPGTDEERAALRQAVITAPRDVPVFRKEVYLSIQEEISADGAASKRVDQALDDLGAAALAVGGRLVDERDAPLLQLVHHVAHVHFLRQRIGWVLGPSRSGSVRASGPIG